MIYVKKNVRKLSNDMMRYERGLLPLFPVEKVHRLRTTYKKLRALIVFVQSFMTAPPVMERRLKVYYRTLGQLRNIQLLSVRICSEHTIAYCDIQQQFWVLEEKCKSQIKDMHIKHILRRWMHKDIHKFPINTPEINARLYFNETLIKIQAIAFRQFIEDEDLHSIRKLLKDAYYLSVMFGFWQKGTATEWAELMNDLGLFHDNVTQCRLINQILPEIKKPESRVHLQEQLEILKNEAERMRSMLIEMVIATFGRSEQFASFRTTEPAICHYYPSLDKRC